MSALPSHHAHTPWQARLELGFSSQVDSHVPTRTVLHHRKSIGPLRVQKALWPEKTGVCHVIMIHPPAGIAGGDELHIEVVVGQQAHAVLTTPGAGKWYKSDGRLAKQTIHLDVEHDGFLEWLPQEIMLFDQAIAQSQTTITLHDSAAFIGWDILVIGRKARDENFLHGHYCSHLSLLRQGRLCIDDRLILNGGDRWLTSPLGLNGHSVSGMMLAVPPIHRRDESLLAQDVQVLRDLIMMMQMPLVVTLLDGVLVARYLGMDARQAMDGFAGVRAKLRRRWFDLSEELPRIWRT
ncbi:urease accessory protein UreD [Aquirhabdus sp.]|uniref:urease accessory protein UreD n=1 Tax=Aquirhabdus sp. TaxID=2824160 RepID=UPI00396CE361